jgi:uncharacterized protein
MTEEVWRRALEAIREYAELAADRNDGLTAVDIVWHGGEPLLLPLSYFKEVLELQKAILPREWAEAGILTNLVQTNLYSVNDALLDLLDDNSFRIGVSVDFRSGVRVTFAGRETEDRVRRNLDRLLERKLAFGLIIVIARHTASNIESVFDDIRKFDVPVRLLPLFSGPSTRPMEGVDISHTETIDAMFRAFRLWFDGGMTPAMDPFDECVNTLILKKLGLQRPRHDRSRLGSEVLQIEPDGALSCVSFARSRHIGNVGSQRIGDIIQSAEYARLVEEEAGLKETVCDGCSYNGPCDTRPIARWFDSSNLVDCPIEKYLYPLFESHLDDANFFSKEFMDVAEATKLAHQGELT